MLDICVWKWMARGHGMLPQGTNILMIVSQTTSMWGTTLGITSVHGPIVQCSTTFGTLPTYGHRVAKPSGIDSPKMVIFARRGTRDVQE